ncbi:DNA-binding protein [Anabaena sp. UHCC 0451]|uniref:DNA-binding protein n=1 Tax=Anabaena sp. UHCC 0451 TaxID=2055235 RepID=UPI002B21F2CA|nr:DNA-binding protein [Anabaena sp. UHCC 0451]MEA5578719.1 DNA-binding protein [Anabaena sp. UHCC 0451]
MESTNQEQNLKEKVFEICENLYKNNEKINRDIVREKLGGGSHTHISPLVSEWKELNKQKLVQQNDDNNIDESTQSGIVKSEESEITEIPQEINATVNTDFIPDGDLNHIVRSGAEKATGLLIAQEAVALHFYQNPDQLPSDLKVKVEEMREGFLQSRSAINKSAYNSQNLINLAMRKINKQQDDLELVG